MSKIYVQSATVRAVEERFKTVVVRGFGKDAVTADQSTGWWITFKDNPTVVRCNSCPDVQPGDRATCTWEFSRK